MSIFNKVLEIYDKYYICSHCLGRMFSLLGTSTTNQERGIALLLSITMENHRIYLSNVPEVKKSIQNLKLLAEKANFLPAQNVLKNEGLNYNKGDLIKSCYLCNNIFSNLQDYAMMANNKLKEIEFNNFLVGTILAPQIINKDDIFKAEFNLLQAESLKNHFNREIGKILLNLLNKIPEFGNPDITIIFLLNYESFDIHLLIRSLFIYGKYNKYVRNIPQTHWDCRVCKGKGCDACNFSGKQYETSVEELISFEFIKASKSTSSKFHGAGREDIDAKMLGTGRACILELKNPKKRFLDLEKIQKKVNKSNKGKVKISNLKYTNKNQVKTIKLNAENTKKIYKALVQGEKKISKIYFKEKCNELKNKIQNHQIQQKTPIRVSHRRADKIREKKIHSINGKFIKSNLYEFTIETQGGTYIKELISGDNGRTRPSFAEIFGFLLRCKELDVLKVF